MFIIRSFCFDFAHYYELNIQQKHHQIDFRANFWCIFAFDLLFIALNWTVSTHRIEMRIGSRAERAAAATKHEFDCDNNNSENGVACTQREN